MTIIMVYLINREKYLGDIYIYIKVIIKYLFFVMRSLWYELLI